MRRSLNLIDKASFKAYIVPAHSLAMHIRLFPLPLLKKL